MQNPLVRCERCHKVLAEEIAGLLVSKHHYQQWIIADLVALQCECGHVWKPERERVGAQPRGLIDVGELRKTIATVGE